MRIHGIVPARSGSKGLPDKNIQQVGGKELVTHAIEFAEMLDLEQVICSTDSGHYASVAEHAGARVPRLRSVEAASDTAMEQDVIDDLDRMYDEYATARPDALVWLRPTFVFRSLSAVEACIEDVVSGRQASRVVVEVDPRLYAAEDSHLVPAFDDEGRSMVRRQGLAPLYHVFLAEVFRYPSIPCPPDYLGENVGFHVAPKVCGIDVDGAEDLEFARAMFEVRREAVLP